MPSGAWLVRRNTGRAIFLGEGKLHWSQGQHNKELEAKPLYAIDTNKGMVFVKGPNDMAFVRTEPCDCGDTGCIGQGRTAPIFDTGETVLVALSHTWGVRIDKSDLMRVAKEAAAAFDTPIDQRNPR